MILSLSLLATVAADGKGGHEVDKFSVRAICTGMFPRYIKPG